MSGLLSAVRRATKRRQAADQEYRQAIGAAWPEHSLREIGEAADLTPTGVRYLLHPDPRKGKTQ